jgi:hypothetical protein
MLTGIFAGIILSRSSGWGFGMRSPVASPWREFVRRHLFGRPSRELLAAIYDLAAARDTLGTERDKVSAELDATKSAHHDAYCRLQSVEAERDGYKDAYQSACTELSRFRELLRLADRSPRRSRQLVFLHIQKTGGNSVLEFVGSRFEWTRVLQMYSPAEFDAYHPAEVPHFDLVCGHIAARNLAACCPDALLCTFLREPIDRTLSVYWYFRTYTGRTRDSIRHVLESARSKSLLEFLRDPTPEVRMHIVDHQTRALAGDWQTFDDRPPRELVADALLTLDQIQCVGVVERIEQGVDHLCWLTGWTPPLSIGRLNVSPTRQRVDELTVAELDALREITTLDAEVYGAACERSAVPKEEAVEQSIVATVS